MLRTSIPLFLAVATLALPARAVDFDHGSQGAVIDVGIGTTPVGDFLLSEIGVETASMRTAGDGRWLLQWDGLAAFKSGTLAATHPFVTLLGGAARGYVEAGRRFSNGAWSPYLGARAGLDFQLLVDPGVGLSDLRSHLDIDGVGDLNLSGALRLAGGASMLGDGHALLLTAFVQENGRLAEATLPGAAFTDFGVDARYDVARSLTLVGEALWGLTPASTDAALHLAQATSHTTLSLLFRKTFSNAMWFAASTSWSRESYSTKYDSPSAEFDTTGAPTFTLTLLYGYPLGSQP